MITVKFILRLIVDTYTEWSNAHASQLGAALAYYTLFSIAPLIVIMVMIAGAVFGEAAARGQIVNSISGQIGPEAAQSVEQMITGVHNSSSGLFTTILSVIILVYGASNLFGHLKDALNALWNVRRRRRKNIFGGILVFARDRLISSVMVIAFGVILLATLALGASFTALNGLLRTILTPITSFLLVAGNVLAGFGLTALLFALIFKLLPDVKISWHVVWVGALVTSFLFNAGVFLIGLYLGYAGSQSALGAAGSLVGVMIWVYYSTQIIFFGAKFALVYASAIGKPIRPASLAVIVKSEPADDQ